MHGIWFSGSTPYTDGVDAVFLPMAGCEYKSVVDVLGYYGYYWSSTVAEAEYYACDFWFSGSNVCTGSSYRGMGFSVRCVKD